MFNKKVLIKLIVALIVANALILALKADNFVSVPMLQISVVHAESAKNHYNNGFRHSEAGNYNEAIAEFTKAIELNPNLTGAYYKRGNLYRKI
ncbi:MAG: tetratricopeptide repeat protein, partial [Selenomonadaceae bacterium]|nr:tetratricopeptide repeat protein [Selenomonadaceae bacterium]